MYIKNRTANRVDPDETAHDEASYLNGHCLQKCLSWSTGMKGLVYIVGTHWDLLGGEIPVRSHILF